jgi:hypothetical protein
MGNMTTIAKQISNLDKLTLNFESNLAQVEAQFRRGDCRCALPMDGKALRQKVERVLRGSRSTEE